MEGSSSSLCLSSGSGDQERQRASEADPQDGKRGTFRGAGSYTVTTATEHGPEDNLREVARRLPSFKMTAAQTKRTNANPIKSMQTQEPHQRSC